MELNLDEMLQKGTEAHEAGKHQEANFLYSAILEIQPNHPEANHNKGLIAFTNGEILEALPFFKTALEAKSDEGQFWISYLEALMKLGRSTEALAVFDKAKDKGVSGEAYDQIGLELSAYDQVGQEVSGQGTEDPSAEQLQAIITLYSQGRLQQALINTSEMLQQYPNSILLYNISGATNAGLMQFDAAINSYKQAIKIKPDYADAYCNMANTLKDMGDLHASIDNYKQAIKINPHYADAYCNMGNAQKDLGDIQAAIVSFKQAVKINPAYVDAYFNLGNALKYAGDFQAAIDSYEQALIIKPDYADAYYNMGNALAEMGNLQLAIDNYEQAVKVNPNHAEAYSNLGNALKDTGDFKAAINSYTRAVKIKPDYADAYCNMGHVLKDMGKFPAAVDSYRQAVKINPDYFDAYFNLGNSLKALDNLPAAIDSYKHAVRIKPDYSDAYSNMGNAMRMLGDTQEAKFSYKQAIKIQPNNANYYCLMGNVMKDMGDLQESIDSYKQAIKIQPNHAEAHSNMGVALCDQNDRMGAINVTKKALKIDPNFATAAWNLSGLAETISESKGWVENCLRLDPYHVNAKLTLSALRFYEGDESDFHGLMQSSFKDHPYMRSFKWVFNLPELPELYFHRWALFDQVVRQSITARPFYEYGVWRGQAFRYLIESFKKGYGFDTFEGLPEDWHSEKAGSYPSDGNIPQILGGEFIVGKFEESLPGFFSEPRPMASVINFDADLYSSTICALNYSKPVIDQQTILIFDEFLINENWEQDEYKALNEFCSHNSCTYEVVAVSFFTKQVAVKLLGI
jgi:tetratricopeptide (TPR) repeat protein